MVRQGVTTPTQPPIPKIKQLNVPIKVNILEWNAGGLLSRIEGLREFLPKPEMTRPRNYTDLKISVGRQIHVCITKIDERSNELIMIEKEACAMSYLSEGALLEGTVRKLFPYGAQIRIGETNRGPQQRQFELGRGTTTDGCPCPLLCATSTYPAGLYVLRGVCPVWVNLRAVRPVLGYKISVRKSFIS